MFPAALAADETYARLREPFAYWNSVGLMAALGVPPLLWLAARRSGHAARQRAGLAGARAAARLPDAVLLARRARALVGVALWFALVPLRLRGAVALAAACSAPAPAVVAWAFAQDG